MDYFASNLTHIIKQKKLTQTQIGEILDVKNTTVSNWQNGISKPNADKLLELCNYLKVNLHEMFYVDFTNKLDNENTNKLEKVREEHIRYAERISIKSEKTVCSATGGDCYFDALKRANEEIAKLKRELSKLKN